ncbi:Hypothetical protein MIP_07099 [Mycobacterium intracellulare subsp. intracellulare MTCC 9506]|uniref:Uncharacterized protein n=1 Tax=Mycobacterium indicus pranii (strain DSM 45239 / MTCC 9506) TaxID=1232724 RepID=J9WIC2_MYCIP|nr:Hypothetical protein MIP_07099 [Mycobacterium intracellulare subsp. intracellulare MTCC 9506]
MGAQPPQWAVGPPVREQQDRGGPIVLCHKLSNQAGPICLTSNDSGSINGP